jgi:hypothetical protein
MLLCRPNAPNGMFTLPLVICNDLNCKLSALLLSCRNDAGILVRTERLRTKDITQKVKAKNYWQVC